MRKTPFVNGEFYHIYNRGVDKRNTFEDREDISRFLQSMDEFNVVEPVGSIYENTFKKTKLGCRTPKLVDKSERLVDFVCYCINPNHFHFIVLQLADNGISEFMKRLSGGYTNYFNRKNKRTGVLFQGKFKSVHIDSNEYLLHLSAYVNLNNKVHQLKGSTFKLVRSSWNEYIRKVGGDNKFFCNKDIILGQFKNSEEYRHFAQNSLKDILHRKSETDGIPSLIIEEL